MNFEHELQCQKHQRLLIGIDEVGRGCFAGPLVIGAAILSLNIKASLTFWQNVELKDSKKLSPKKRSFVNSILTDHLFFWKVFYLSSTSINMYGLQKSYNAFLTKICLHLQDVFPNAELIVDGRKILNCPAIFLEKGDDLVKTISAASIVAKVHRDVHMTENHSLFPHFNWKKNKGYGTKEHRDALKTFGITPLHRVQFVKEYC